MNLNILMRWLPPPAIVALTAGLMWLSESYLFYGAMGWGSQRGMVELLVIFGLVALALGLMGVAAWQFRQARTTLLPFAPEQTRQLVITGIFRYSRNPIYVGDALLLLAWGSYLGNVLSLVWLVPFIIYMNKVQIAAEEHALAAKFGREYQDYCQQVRRWI